jgi:glycosyltransferase involved in cell wall biosynthesis
MVLKEQLKVLYVCPFAHYTGHFSWAAVHETQALAKAGAEVDLLTFSGVTDEGEVKVPQFTVRNNTKLGIPIYHLANFLRRWKGIGFISMFLEAFLTQSAAIRLKRKKGYDIIHLRDGEPFLFLPHLLSLTVRDYSWIVSLTGSNFVNSPPTQAAIKQNFRLLLYALYIKTINCNWWKPVYHRSLVKNRFLFLTQNETIKQISELYMGGVLSGKVFCLSLGVNEIDETISKEEARKYFGLPQDKPVFLSFGFLHAGKDVEVIFRALKDIPDTFLLHGGDQMFRLHLPNSASVVEKYNMRDRTVIRDYYIPEEEKPYYFFAADAIILSYTRQFLSTTSLLWQACRFRIPVIASDNGQLKELMEEYKPGLVFRAQDSDSLREAILRFINLKPREIEALKDNCRRFVHEFSLESWARKCLEVYNKLLADIS